MKDDSRVFNIHHPSPSDLELVFDFMNACDVAEYGEPDTDLEDLQDLWQEVDLAKDAWLAVDASGALTGYALLTSETEGKRYLDLFINLAQSPEGLEQALLDLALIRFAGMRAAGESSPQCSLNAYVSGVNARTRAAFEARDFQAVNYHYRMQIDFTKPIPSPDFPQGYTLGHFTAGSEQELYDLVYASFTASQLRIGGFESWKKAVFSTARYDPELFLTLRHAGRLVGAVVCYDEETRGWVRQLAVAGDQQGRGLGSRLLRTVFAICQARGLPTVSLGVSSKNENAKALYERNGMRRTREFVEYRQG